MTKRRVIHDFGFDPSESSYHFAVVPEGSNILVVERYAWPPDEATAEAAQPSLKAVLDRYRWGRIAEPVADMFNRRLRPAGYPPGRWKEGETMLDAYLGKELTLLAWAVEDADPTLIPNVVANWIGLAPEERWWLYTTVNATTGHPQHGRDRGWRKAIKIAFAENPAPAPPSSLLRDEPRAMRERSEDGYRILPPAPAPTPSRRSRRRAARPANQIAFGLDDPAGRPSEGNGDADE